MIKNEVWKEIIGYEHNYMVSNHGNVLSKSKNILIKQQVSNRPYKRVCLSKNSKRKKFLVHRLVAIHFIEMLEGKNIVNHLDGNTFNNHIDNLEWTTSKGNRIHSRDVLGFSCSDEKNPNSKLTKKDIIYIRKKRGVLTNRVLGKMFEVAPQHISHIQLKKSWASM